MDPWITDPCALLLAFWIFVYGNLYVFSAVSQLSSTKAQLDIQTLLFSPLGHLDGWHGMFFKSRIFIFWWMWCFKGHCICVWKLVCRGKSWKGCDSMVKVWRFVENFDKMYCTVAQLSAVNAYNPRNVWNICFLKPAKLRAVKLMCYSGQCLRNCWFVCVTLPKKRFCCLESSDKIFFHFFSAISIKILEACSI